MTNSGKKLDALKVKTTGTGASTSQVQKGNVDKAFIPLKNTPQIMLGGPEAVPGGISLKKRIDDGPPLQHGEIVRIGFHIAKGLAAIHDQGIAHNGITKENILLIGEKHDVKICNFDNAVGSQDPQGMAIDINHLGQLIVDMLPGKEKEEKSKYGFLPAWARWCKESGKESLKTAKEVSVAFEREMSNGQSRT